MASANGVAWVDPAPYGTPQHEGTRAHAPRGKASRQQGTRAKSARTRRRGRSSKPRAKFHVRTGVEWGDEPVHYGPEDELAYPTSRDVNYIQETRLQYLKHSPYARAEQEAYGQPESQPGRWLFHPGRGAKPQATSSPQRTPLHQTAPHHVRPSRPETRPRSGPGPRALRASNGHTPTRPSRSPSDAKGRGRSHRKSPRTRHNGNRRSTSPRPAPTNSQSPRSPRRDVHMARDLLPAGVGPELLMLTSFIVQTEERFSDYLAFSAAMREPLQDLDQSYSEAEAQEATGAPYQIAGHGRKRGGQTPQHKPFNVSLDEYEALMARTRAAMVRAQGGTSAPKSEERHTNGHAPEGSRQRDADAEARASAALGRVGKGYLARKRVRNMKDDQARREEQSRFEQRVQEELARRLEEHALLEASERARQSESATHVQRAVRGRLARRRVRRVRDEKAAIRIQSAARRRSAARRAGELRQRRESANQERAAQTIQRHTRGKAARDRVARMRAERDYRRQDRAALRIQSSFRGHLGRQRAQGVRTTRRRHHAAVKIQSQARSRSARKRVQRRRVAARRRAQLVERVRRKRAATKIQCAERSRVARKRVSARRAARNKRQRLEADRAARLAQRQQEARDLAARQERAAVGVQRVGRGWQARRRVQHIKDRAAREAALAQKRAQFASASSLRDHHHTVVVAQPVDDIVPDATVVEEHDDDGPIDEGKSESGDGEEDEHDDDEVHVPQRVDPYLAAHRRESERDFSTMVVRHQTNKEAIEAMTAVYDTTVEAQGRDPKAIAVLPRPFSEMELALARAAVQRIPADNLARLGDLDTPNDTLAGMAACICLCLKQPPTWTGTQKMFKTGVFKDSVVAAEPSVLSMKRLRVAGSVMQQHMLVRMSHETESEAVTAIIRWLVAFIGPFVSVPPPPAGFASSAALVTSGTTLDKNAAASATRRVQLSQLTEAQRIAFVHETNVAMKRCVAVVSSGVTARARTRIHALQQLEDRMADLEGARADVLLIAPTELTELCDQDKPSPLLVVVAASISVLFDVKPAWPSVRAFMLKPTFLPEVVKLKVDDATHRSVDVARKLISSNKEVATMRGNHNYPQAIRFLARWVTAFTNAFLCEAEAEEEEMQFLQEGGAEGADAGNSTSYLEHEERKA